MAISTSVEKRHYRLTTVWPFTYGILLAFTLQMKKQTPGGCEACSVYPGAEKDSNLSLSAMKSCVDTLFCITYIGCPFAHSELRNAVSNSRDHSEIQADSQKVSINY